MSPRVAFRLRDTLDRRTPEQLRSYEEIERKRYEWRVAHNPKERARLARLESETLPALLRRQAS